VQAVEGVALVAPGVTSGGVVSVTRMSSNAGTQAACGEAYRQVDAPSRVATSAHARQPAGVRVVRGVTLDPGG
jgi:hypothetical protein